MNVLLLMIGLAPLVAAAPGRPYSLMAGDPAPALAVQAWVQGEPVPAFEPGRIYAVDFWATWCGPCKESMPGLSRLQKEFESRVTVIGVDTWDYADRVAPFLAKMGDQVSYRIAIDRQPPPPAGEDNVPMYVKAHGESSKGWMVASGMADEGIPAIFVVDGMGRVAWIGDDLGRLKEVLTQLLAGTYDLDRYAASYAKDAVVLSQGRALQGEIFHARQKKDWTAAVAGARTLIALDERYHPYAGMLFKLLYVQLGDRSHALAFADAQKRGNRSADAFQEMAEVVASADSVSAAEVAAAEKLARHSSALAKDQAPGPYVALAKLAIKRGDKATAVAMQTRALERMTGSGERTEAEAKLAEYSR